MGQSLEEIAGTYQLPLAGVYLSMAFYFEHRQEIDRRTDEANALADNALADNARAKQPALLQEKLNAARGYA